MKIAFKTAKNIPNLPNGYVIEHFSTDGQPDGYYDGYGYTVVSKEIFETILKSNIDLFRNWEASKGIVTIDSSIPVPPPPKRVPEPVPPEVRAAREKAIQEEADNQKLFQEFLAWKAAQQGK